MEIVPVIDLKGGVVVRARRGERALYRPIATPLSRSSAPGDVVRGLMTLHPFGSLYVADLDAIAGEAPAEATLRRLAADFPGVAFWVDNGCADAEAARAFLAAHPGCVLVLGSESQHDTGLLASLRGHERVILSLDFRGDAFQGPPAILAEPGLWPRRIIAMTLGRVGSGAGPDCDRLAAIVAAAAGRRVYAAGGIRDAEDLRRIARLGAAGALVASALHEGTLRGTDATALA